MPLSVDVSWRSSSNRPKGFAPAEVELPPLRGVNIRLERITVVDIKRGFFNPRPDADIYPLFLILAPNTDEPIQLSPLAVYNDIRPGQTVPISSVAPPTLFRSGEALPDWIDVHVLVMKSRERQRQLATGINEALASTAGKAATTAILGALTAANPVAGGVGQVALQLLEVVCDHLSQGKDTQLFYARASIERADGYCIGQELAIREEIEEGDHAQVKLRVKGEV